MQRGSSFCWHDVFCALSFWAHCVRACGSNHEQRSSHECDDPVAMYATKWRNSNRTAIITFSLLAIYYFTVFRIHLVLCRARVGVSFRMSSSVITPLPIVRPKHLRRRRREPSNHPYFTSLIVMALVSLTRGFLLKSGVWRCRHLHRVVPSRSPQFPLYSVARAQPNAQSSEDVSASVDNPLQPDNPAILKKPWKTLFDLELPEGQCIGVRLNAENTCSNNNNNDELSTEAISSPNHWIHACLHPEEVEYAVSQPSEYTRETFLLGRLAMRQIVSHDGPILKDDHGRPNVPILYLGSISHKRSLVNGTTGVALLAPRVRGMGVGVDIELASSNRKSIAKRVLTENEINELGRIEVSCRYLVIPMWLLVSV